MAGPPPAARAPAVPAFSYVEHEPAAPLRRFVRRVWDLETPPGAPPPPPDRVLPDGCVEVVLHYRDAFLRTDSAGREATQHRHALVGQLRTALALRPTGRVGVLGVRFEPAGASLLLGLSMHEATERSFALEDVLGRRAEDLAGAVRAADGPRGRIAAVERLLTRAAHAAPARRTIAEEAAAAILAAEGRCAIRGVAADVGAAGRRLERRFRDEVGVSPKTLARIVRFQSAVRLLRGGGRSLVGAALDGGYADQPHFARDFAEFAGESPGRWLAHEHGLAAAFVG